MPISIHIHPSLGHQRASTVWHDVKCMNSHEFPWIPNIPMGSNGGNQLPTLDPTMIQLDPNWLIWGPPSTGWPLRYSFHSPARHSPSSPPALIKSWLKIVENKMGCPKSPSQRKMAACWWRPTSQIWNYQPLGTSNHWKAVWKWWLKTKIFGIPNSVSSNWLWGPIFEAKAAKP